MRVVNTWIALAAVALSACAAAPAPQQTIASPRGAPTRSAESGSADPATSVATRPANAGCPEDPTWAGEDVSIYEQSGYSGGKEYPAGPMTPLHGVPLEATGLRLLLDGCIVDVDTGVETRTSQQPKECFRSAKFAVLPDESLEVVTRSGARTKIPAPTTIGHPGFPGSCPAISPDGRYVMVEYGHPAWPGPRQRLDLWLYDLQSRRWVHVPSMPAPVALKFTEEAWSKDGRLVILGSFYGVGRALAVWRPGERDLSVRVVDYPNRHGLEVLPSK